MGAVAICYVLISVSLGQGLKFRLELKELVGRQQNVAADIHNDYSRDAAWALEALDAARTRILVASVLFAAVFILAAGWVAVTLRRQIKDIQDANASLDIAIRRENQISNSLRIGEAKARELSATAARSEQTLNQFFDDAPFGIFWISSEGKMLRANAPAQRLIGETDMHKCLGSSMMGYFGFSQRSHALMCRLQKGKTVIGFEARIKQSGGKLIHVIMDANVHWKGSNFEHARVFARDITELKQAEHDRKVSVFSQLPSLSV
jgi:PAS domain S-box-containing protein